jgi:hypothetical protein
MKTAGGGINTRIQNYSQNGLTSYVQKRRYIIFHFEKIWFKVDDLKQKIIFLTIHFLLEDYGKIIENNYNS